MSSTPVPPAEPDPTATDDLEDGQGPDETLPALVDDLEDRVLRARDNPLLDVEEDADASAVAADPENSADEVQPRT